LASQLGSRTKSNNHRRMPRIAITLGDPAGIGPEVVEAALNCGELPRDVDWLVVGSTEGVTAGKPDAHSARLAMEALSQSVEMLQSGDADGVVTGPVAKNALQSIGFNHPGQTEFYAEAFGVQDYGMLLTGEHLTVGLATIHEPLSRVVASLEMEQITRIGKLTADFLKRRRIASPRIAVCGLNPHAGENGCFGDEEARIIEPAIRVLQSTGLAGFSGPHIPDAVFRDAANGKFDAVIAMYHDQGLIPLKLLDFDNAVNVTLGLPKPRTSPDHGTAFDIAGKGLADPSSMISAMRLCAELCQRS